MSLEFFNNLNIIIQPLLGIFTLANTAFLTISFIENNFSQKDKFYVKIRRNEILFKNKGRNSITINEISVQFQEDDGIFAFLELNLLKKRLKISGRDYRIIEINPSWTKLQEENEILYLCFRIASESGRHYDSICCQLLDKDKKIITKQRKLKKEIFDLEYKAKE